MNVHQACMATSEQLLKHRSAQMGFPIDAMNTLKGLTFEGSVSYREDATDVHSLARNATNNRYKISRERLFTRRVLELEVVKHSLELLDQILFANDSALILMIDLLYAAARRYAERSSGEAVVVAWAVCEKLLSSAWNSLLHDAKSSGRMTNRRREKLEGLDYTASVMIEMLEINNRIDYDSYLVLERVRKSRNRWVHNMREPNNLEVSEAIRAAQDLLQRIKGVRVLLSLTGPGPGVPGWYIWHWERIKKQRQL